MPPENQPHRINIQRLCIVSGLVGIEATAPVFVSRVGRRRDTNFSGVCGCCFKSRLNTRITDSLISFSRILNIYFYNIPKFNTI